jgi:tetraacyldisaccharide-1-P 4'-kinase
VLAFVRPIPNTPILHHSDIILLIVRTMRYRFDQILYQKDRSLLGRAVLFPLYLLSLLYGWAIRLRMCVYRIGLCKARRLPCPVISVGNITVGGTGKTPLVMALAKGLRKRGISVAVLTRGYRSRGSSGSWSAMGKMFCFHPRSRVMNPPSWERP